MWNKIFNKLALMKNCKFYLILFIKYQNYIKKELFTVISNLRTSFLQMDELKLLILVMQNSILIQKKQF